ncbi:MAG TPA: DUF2520 domain-containing protein [Chitinophagales bacterium]
MKDEKMKLKVSFIGSGNTATQLALALHEKGIAISQIISSSFENANFLAQKMNAKASDNLLDFDTPNVDILLIAVTDDKIAKVASDLAKQTNVIVAHTSGSVNMSELEKHTNYGVFYPFVSIQKNIRTDFSNAPFLIEGNNNFVVSKLKELAIVVSNNIIDANSQQRQMLHLSAIFANNFVNNQLSIAQDILAKNNLPFSLLRPLLANYFEKLQTHLPSELQTGPAIRHDTATIEKHLELLQTLPEYQKIYALISDNIQRKK